MADTALPSSKPRPPPPVGKKPQFPQLKTAASDQQTAHSSGLISDATPRHDGHDSNEAEIPMTEQYREEASQESNYVTTPGLHSAHVHEPSSQVDDTAHDPGTAITAQTDILSPLDDNHAATSPQIGTLATSPQHGDRLADQGFPDSHADDAQSVTSPMTLHQQIDILLAKIRQLEDHPTTMLNKLEARIDALEKRDDDSESESGDNEGDKTGVKFCKPSTCLNIITINDWDKRKFSREQPHALIDVVVAADYFGERKDPSGETMSPVIDHTIRDHFSQFKDNLERVKFIQVNSVPFRHLYHYVIGTELTFEPMIVLAPFKSLTIFEKEYQQMLESLEGKWKDKELDDPRAQVHIKKYSKPNPDDQDADTPPRHDADDLTHDSYEAYLALKCWLEFYNRFVKAKWDWLRSDKVDSVRFGDLCDLFQPGDDVYHTGNAQRVWRVCKITGGRPVLQRLLYGSLDTEGAQDRPATVKAVKHPSEAQHPLEDEAADPVDLETDWTVLQVEGYYLDYDGSEYGPVHKMVTLKHFPGRKSVRSLKLWPLRLVKDVQRQYDELTAPGIKFFEKCQPGLHYYDGRTLLETPSEQPLSSDLGKFKSQDVTSAVYVDFVKAFQRNPDWMPDIGLKEFEQADPREITVSATDSLPIESKFRMADVDFEFAIQNIEFPDYWALRRYRQTDEWIRESGGSSWTERSNVKRADHILFPNRLYGFVFQTRDWACFDVDSRHLKDVKKDASAWNELALPDSYKQTLESLIELYFANKQAMAAHGKAGFEFDFIHGKGSGLVVLLHGHPGVGKTSTAESIAAKYQKPLLPITCGNLGITPQSVEQNLNENFQLAQAWDAIVLLDEADIFLTRRNKRDLERNAVVSVFLRTLEYYTGILFLTTNRVGAFDPAFISRVHCSLYYPPLTIKQNDQIWTNNLRRLLRQPRLDGSILNVDGIGEEILSFARNHFLERKKLGDTRVWNGRQIRNSFQTAVALAEYEAKETREKEDDPGVKVMLRASHFATVTRASAEFEKYLESTLNMTEAEMLDEEGERAANYSTPTPFGRDQPGVLPQEQSRVSWMNGTPIAAGTMSQNPGTPTPGADLYRRPTFNSRLMQEKQGYSPATNLQGPANAYTQSAPAGVQSLPSGYTVVMTPQGPQLVQLQGTQMAQPFAATASPGQVPQQFVQQAGAGASVDHGFGTPSRSNMAGSSLHALNQPLNASPGQSGGMA